MGKLRAGTFDFRQITTPTDNPASGRTYLYIKSDGAIYSKDSAGTEVNLTGAGGGQITSGAVLMDKLTGSTDHTLQHLQDYGHSAGIVQAVDINNIITLGTGLTVDTTAFVCYLRTSNSKFANLIKVDIAAQTGLSIPTDNTNQYLVVDYNAGTPQITVTPTDTSNGNTIFLLGSVFREVGVIHEIKNDGQVFGDHARIMTERFAEVTGAARASGAILSETGTLNLNITEGLWWGRARSFSVNVGGFNSSGGDRFSLYYRDGIGGHTEDTLLAAIDTTLFDDNSGTKATLTAGNYGVVWVYSGFTDGDVRCVLGQGDYASLASAEISAIPTDIPPIIIPSYYKLIGKIMYLNGAGTFASVFNVNSPSFTEPSITNHQTLAGLTLANTGVTYGHIDDQAQTIYGVKTFNGNVILSGDLTVNGTTTTINASVLDVTDKNITMGNVTTPTDVTADGGGITLKGATNKTINWVNATTHWTSSDGFMMPTLKIGGDTTVVPSSPITLVGTSGNLSRVNTENYQNGLVSGGLQSFKSRGTEATPTSVLTNDQLLFISGSGYYGAGQGRGFTMRARATENFATGSYGTSVTFATTPNGSTTNTDALTLDQDQSAIFAGAATVNGKFEVAGVLNYDDTLSNLNFGTNSLSSITTGSSNIAFGENAMQSATTSAFNVCIGASAGKNVNGGGENFFLGASCGLGAVGSTAQANIVIGKDNMSAVTTASHNVAIGKASMNNTTTATNNVCLGSNSGSNITTGQSNVGIGTFSLGFPIASASSNVCLGYFSGATVQGNNNICIGENSGVSVNTGNVLIGYKAGSYETGSDTFLIDNQDRGSLALGQTGALLYGKFNATAANQILSTPGKFGIGTTSPVANVHNDSNNAFANYVIERSGGVAGRRPFAIGLTGANDDVLQFAASTDTTPTNAINGTRVGILNLTASGKVLIGSAVDSDTGTGSGVGTHNLQSNGFIKHKAGWRDNIISFTAGQGGAIAPTWANMGNNIFNYRFAVGDTMHLNFHVDHDYLPGSVAYPHIHFTPTTSMTAGQTVVWTMTYIVARGHSQGDSLTGATTTITLTYTATGTEVAGEHILVESSLAQAFSLIEPDTCISFSVQRATGTYGSNVFGLFCDLHYQSDREVTLNKAPNFYV